MEQNPGLAFADDVRETDALASLEERIHKTVALVTRLRSERDAAVEDATAAKAALERAEAELRQSKQGTEGMTSELANLRAERQQVRNRLEKLLGHIDQLGAA